MTQIMDQIIYFAVLVLGLSEPIYFALSLERKLGVARGTQEKTPLSPAGIDSPEDLRLLITVSLPIGLPILTGETVEECVFLLCFFFHFLFVCLFVFSHVLSPI